MKTNYDPIIFCQSESLNLEINTLDKVIIAENYGKELEVLKEEGIDESLLTYTNNGIGIGIAKSITVDEKDIIIFSEKFLSMMKEKTLLNIIAHELSHIDDRNKKKICMQDFFNEKYSNYQDRVYYPLVKASWAEFYANYKASSYLTERNINYTHTLFFDAINKFDENIFDKKWDYQNNIINLDEFMNSFKKYAYFLFKQAA